MQACELGSGHWLLLPWGQQLIWLPQPSEAKPQLCPWAAQPWGVQVCFGSPHWLGASAPQNCGAVQVTPPLVPLQV